MVIIITYRKLAQLAGVSLSTVSKAMSGSPEISQTTAERIRKIAETYGIIRPNYHKNHSTIRIAIIVPEIISVHYSSMTSILIGELQEFGIEPSIYICGFEDKKFYEIISLLCEDETVDGIITFSTINYLQKIKIPMIRIGVSLPYSDCDTIGSNIDSSIFEATEYLKALGHRRIGFISEKNTGSKLRSFMNALKQLELKVDPKDMFVSDKRFEQIGIEAAEYYVSMPDRPTAIMTAYDEIALGAIHIFNGKGISVPDDISIIGMNDIPSASYANIPLTTIRTYDNEILHMGVKMLLHHIKNPETHMTQNINVSCKLIIRNSTAKPKIKE